jgi:hypothetical protein
MTKSSQPSRSTSSQGRLENFLQLSKTAIEAKIEVRHILVEAGYIESRPVPMPRTQKEAEELVVHIFDRFHPLANTIAKRHADRPTLIINDEKDVQDLMHPFLKLHFDDVRKEEPTESYAGGSTSMDFLLPSHRIGIEVKMGKVGERRLKEQINDDKNNYRRHSKCDKLLVMVYDPDQDIDNPRGFETDLSDNISGLETKIYVTPF